MSGNVKSYKTPGRVFKRNDVMAKQKYDMDKTLESLSWSVEMVKQFLKQNYL